MVRTPLSCGHSDYPWLNSRKKWAYAVDYSQSLETARQTVTTISGCPAATRVLEVYLVHGPLAGFSADESMLCTTITSLISSFPLPSALPLAVYLPSCEFKET